MGPLWGYAYKIASDRKKSESHFKCFFLDGSRQAEQILMGNFFFTLEPLFFTL